MAMGEGFDFDQWSSLAARDPDGFERRRTALLDALISRAPAHRQASLRRLQWRIDSERRRCGSDLGACLKLSGMMWDRVVGPSGLLDALRGQLSPGLSGGGSGPAAASGQDSGTVLPFRPR